VDILTRHRIDEIDPPLLKKINVREKYWGARSSGPVHVSPDCGSLTDSTGKPMRLRDGNHLKHYWKLVKRFKARQSRSLVRKRYWDMETFRDNQKYLKREYGDGVKEVYDVVKGRGFPSDVRLYATNLITLTAYVQYGGGQPKLIFVCPLTW
jgi:hypothetical protein